MARSELLDELSPLNIPRTVDRLECAEQTLAVLLDIGHPVLCAQAMRWRNHERLLQAMEEVLAHPDREGAARARLTSRHREELDRLMAVLLDPPQVGWVDARIVELERERWQKIVDAEDDEGLLPSEITEDVLDNQQRIVGDCLFIVFFGIGACFPPNRYREIWERAMTPIYITNEASKHAMGLRETPAPEVAEG